MTLECINPPDLPTPKTYTQVVVARGSKLIFVAGQEPEDLNGKLVGRGDLAVQARQVFTNLGRALAGAGALPNDVARITIYVVNYQRDTHLPIIEEARVGLFGAHKAADVVVGVATLSPDYLIEVDAIAVVDGWRTSRPVSRAILNATRARAKTSLGLLLAAALRPTGGGAPTTGQQPALPLLGQSTIIAVSSAFPFRGCLPWTSG